MLYILVTIQQKRRLKIELCSILESLEKGEIKCVKWANSKNQLADSLTKEGGSREKLYDALNGKTKLFVQYYSIIFQVSIYFKKKN